MSENVQKLQNLYAAFERGDINAILENVSDGVTWGTESIVTDVPWYSIRTGRAGVADFFSTLDREVEFTEFEPRVFAGAGDQVLVQVDIAYRVKKNGQAARVSSIHQFVVGADGKVTSFRAHEDTASVARAWNA